MEINMDTLKLFLQFLVTPVVVFGVLAWLLQKLFEKWISRDLKKYEFELNIKLGENKIKLDALILEYKSSLDLDLEKHKAKLNAEYTKKQFEFQTKFSAYHQKQFEVAGELFGLFNDLRYKIDTFARNQTGVSELNNKLKEFEEMFWRNRFYFDEELCGKIEEQRIFLREVLNGYTDFQISTEILTPHISNDSSIQGQLTEAQNKMMGKFNEMRESYTNDKTLLEPEFRKLLSTEKSETSLENTN